MAGRDTGGDLEWLESHSEKELKRLRLQIAAWRRLCYFELAVIITMCLIFLGIF